MATTDFKLHLDILPLPQRRLWDELIDVPETFILYGGTAIALYLGHRESVDFDFFGSERFDPDNLYKTIPFLANSEVIQKSENTLTCLVNRGGTVQVSFFGVPDVVQIQTPFRAPDNGLQIATLLDLAGMKASVVQKRAEAKDYIDIDALIQDGRIDLPLALSAGRIIYGRGFNPAKGEGTIIYNDDQNVMQYCDGSTWRRLQGSNFALTCTAAIGTVCADGSVYAGLSPDGNVPMYATRCDYNQSWNGSTCANTRQGITWNNGNAGNRTDTPLGNCGSAPACDNSGETNTTVLKSEDSNGGEGGTQPHAAAVYCDGLNVHGHSDWYLPSAPELNVLFINKTAIGYFDVSGSSNYWSSSENNNNNAYYQRFSDGGTGGDLKEISFYVRCVRH